MRLAVTGTPGTGKTAATERLPGYDVVHLNRVVRERGLWTERDPERDSLVADLEALRDWLAGRDPGAGGGGTPRERDASGRPDPPVTVVESHLAHLLPADRVVVLRCRPDALEERLLERGESPESAAENRESEALGTVLAEAVERFGEAAVHEVDTTDRQPGAVADAIRAVAAGDREPSPDRIDYLEYA